MSNFLPQNLSITGVSLFLWAFFSPLVDLPKINIMGFSSRPGYLLLIPFFLILLIKFKNFFKIINKNKKISIIIGAIIIYNFSNLFFQNEIKNRTFGMLIWLSINLIILLWTVENRDKIVNLYNGYLYGQLFNALYLIYTVLFYPNVFLLKPMEPYFFDGMIRGFGFSGEPSYFSVSVLPLICFLFLQDLNKKNITFLGILILAAFLSFSRLSMLGILIMPVFFLLAKGKMKKSFGVYLCITLLSLVSAYAINPGYFSKVNYTKSKRAEIDKNRVGYPQKLRKLELYTGLKMIDRGWNSQRIMSFKRSFLLFTEKPLFGVGIGNSHQALRERFLHTSAEHYYVEGCSNLFIEILLEQGLIGSLLLLTLCFLLIKALFLSFTLPITLAPFLFLILFVMQFAQTLTIPTILVFTAIMFLKTDQRISFKNSGQKLKNYQNFLISIFINKPLPKSQKYNF